MPGAGPAAGTLARAPATLGRTMDGTDGSVAKQGIAGNQLVSGGARTITYSVKGTSQQAGRIAGTLGMSFSDSQYDVFGNFARAITASGIASPHLTWEPTQQDILDSMLDRGRDEDQVALAGKRRCSAQRALAGLPQACAMSSKPAASRCVCRA